jgi:uncharacterized protein (TIGR02677 family)
MEKYDVFAHLNTEKAFVYRAVLRSFREARLNFQLHLRREDVSEMVGLPDEEVRPPLAQLVAWGNLEAHQDHSEVHTFQDFYRERFLYQLTKAGEAAELALEHFEERLAQVGELQAAALDDILELLQELVQLSRNRSEEAVLKAYRAFRQLWSRFEELTERSQAFMSSLQRTIDLYDIELDAFMAYKDHLLDYLERFLAKLTTSRSTIVEALQSIHEVKELLNAASRRELVDRVNPDENEYQSVRLQWTARWEGLRGWFVDQPGKLCQAELLRSRARSAIPALLTVVALIRERTDGRQNRLAELRTLARWFAEADSDEEARILWRAGFGLYGTRHLQVDEETLLHRDQTGESSNLSWTEAQPLVLTPRLRETGRYNRKGGPNTVIDIREDQRAAEIRARREAEQLEKAQAVFLKNGPCKLSELPYLSETEFGLFLELLGETLSLMPNFENPIQNASSDGSLFLTLEPLPDGLAHIETEIGTLTARDCWFKVESAVAEEMVV